MTSSYQDHAFQEERNYRKAFSEWASSDPIEFNRAKECGVAKPKLEATKDTKATSSKDEDDKPTVLDFQGIDSSEEQSLPEEVFLQVLQEQGVLKPIQSRPAILTAISRALEAATEQIEQNRNEASASRIGDAILATMQILGMCNSVTTRFRAKILMGVIGRGDGRSLAEIADEFGVTRSDASKIARGFVEGLSLPFNYLTRNDEIAEQNASRATEVHLEKRLDRKAGEAIRIERANEKLRLERIDAARKKAEARLKDRLQNQP